MEMYPKNVLDIHVPRRDNHNRHMGPPIIKLEFEKDTLDPHVIIGGESIQLKMKKERPTLCERCPKTSAENAQSLCKKEECTIMGGIFASTANNPTR